MLGAQRLDLPSQFILDIILLVHLLHLEARGRSCVCFVGVTTNALCICTHVYMCMLRKSFAFDECNVGPASPDTFGCCFWSVRPVVVGVGFAARSAPRCSNSRTCTWTPRCEDIQSQLDPGHPDSLLEFLSQCREILQLGGKLGLHGIHLLYRGGVLR